MQAWILTLALIAPQEPVVIEAGKLICEVHVSRTATVFHVVDQLSEWSEFCHRQYGSHFGPGLTDEDRRLLADHAAIRNVRGWGQGLEQTFYSPLDLEGAVAAGINAGHLTEAQGKTEAKILAHFGPRVDTLIADHRKILDSYPGRLRKETERLAGFADRISRFAGVAEVRVPIYLLANPHDGDLGGGFNGGVIALEIPRVRDAFPTLLHELFHAFLEPRRGALEDAIKGVKGLDFMTMNEGLAYALSPGIFHAEKEGSDPLARAVGQFEAGGRTLDDYYARVNRFGLALRPLMKEALESGTMLDAVLPRAVDAWRVVCELSLAGKAGKDYRADPTPSAFVFGPGWKAASERIRTLKRHCFARNHSAAHYDEVFTKHDKPGDLVIVLLALSSAERVPDAWREVLPRPWDEIEAALRKGETVQLEGEWRKMRTLILAAPTTEALETLIRKTDLIR